MKRISVLKGLVWAIMGLLQLSCGSSTKVPSLASQIKSVAPSGFGGSATSLYSAMAMLKVASRSGLDTTNIRNNFFGGSSGVGPTQIFPLLAGVDERMGELSSSGSSCIKGKPVKYTITPFSGGSAVPMYAQCYRGVSGQGTTPYTNPAGVKDPSFFMIGLDSSGVYYLFTAVGAQWLAATETPLPGSTTQYAVHLWMGVGYGNGASSTGTPGSIGSGDGQCGTYNQWDSCSYGVVELMGNIQISNGTISKLVNFEFTVAGLGLGYCGLQAISDGNNVYAEGSVDGSSCSSPSTICFTASSTSATTDSSSSATCPAGQTCTNSCTVPPVCTASDATAGRCAVPSASTGFALTPIGRKAISTGVKSTSYGATNYPSSPNVTITGSSSDALYFVTGPAISGNTSFTGATTPITAAWAAAAGVTSF